MMEKVRHIQVQPQQPSVLKVWKYKEQEESESSVELLLMIYKWWGWKQFLFLNPAK